MKTVKNYRLPNRLVFILSILLIGIVGFALNSQSIRFTYDQAGNRILRFPDSNNAIKKANYAKPYAGASNLHAQTVGNISALLGGVSLRVSNDCLGGKHDRWRTSAVAIGYDKYEIGTYITTNEGNIESGDQIILRDVPEGTNAEAIDINKIPKSEK